MKRVTDTVHRALLASLLVATAACADDPVSQASPKTEAASQSLWRQIQIEVGDAACDGPQQCHSIPVGAKACGGPDGYLAWSGKRSDAEKLRNLVDQHAAARKAENLSSGRMSDCRLVTDPGASCRAAHCSLNSGAGGSPGAQPAK